MGHNTDLTSQLRACVEHSLICVAAAAVSSSARGRARGQGSWLEKVGREGEGTQRGHLSRQSRAAAISKWFISSYFFTRLCVRDRHSHVSIVSLRSSHWAFRPYSTVGEFNWCRWPGPPSTRLDSLDSPEEKNHVLVRESDESILHHVRDLISPYRWTECMSNHCRKSALNSQSFKTAFFLDISHFLVTPLY